MTMRKYRVRLERFLRDCAADSGLRQALADGTPAAIAAAVVRIRDEGAVASTPTAGVAAAMTDVIEDAATPRGYARRCRGHCRRGRWP